MAFGLQIRYALSADERGGWDPSKRECRWQNGNPSYSVGGFADYAAVPDTDVFALPEVRRRKNHASSAVRS